MARLFAALIVASSGLLLGCGLRGPLYLPEDKARPEGEAARPAAPEDGKISTPQPAPQAQKRERPGGTSVPLTTPPAN